MSTSPSLTPVATPAPLTLATPLALVVHSRSGAATGLPPVSMTVAANVPVSPMRSESGTGDHDRRVDGRRTDRRVSSSSEQPANARIRPARPAAATARKRFDIGFLGKGGDEKRATGAHDHSAIGMC
jgi:hypothetical protein